MKREPTGHGLSQHSRESPTREAGPQPRQVELKPSIRKVTIDPRGGGDRVVLLTGPRNRSGDRPLEPELLPAPSSERHRTRGEGRKRSRGTQREGHRETHRYHDSLTPEMIAEERGLPLVDAKAEYDKLYTEYLDEKKKNQEHHTRRQAEARTTAKAMDSKRGAPGKIPWWLAERMERRKS